MWAQRAVSIGLFIALVVSLLFGRAAVREKDSLLKTVSVMKTHRQIIRIPVFVPGVGLGYRTEETDDTTASKNTEKRDKTIYGSPFRAGPGLNFVGLIPKPSIYGSVDIDLPLIHLPLAAYLSYTP
jgi:hypothetical protein